MEKFYNVKINAEDKCYQYVGITDGEATEIILNLHREYYPYDLDVDMVLANPEFPFPMKDSFTFA